MGNKLTFLLNSVGDLAVALLMYGPVNGPWEPDIYFSASTVDNSTLQPSCCGTPAPGTRHLFWNINRPCLSLGTWHKIEHYVKFSTTSTSQDGILKLWIDGGLTHNYTNVNFPQAGNFTEFQFAPNWGGTGDVKTENDYFRFDHIHISTATDTQADVAPPTPPSNFRVQ